MTQPQTPNDKLIAQNRKASFHYTILDTYEAGIALQGTEVKSIRNGKCQIQESFARFEKNELYVYNMNISTYEQGNIHNHLTTRPRKLLLHRKELNKIFGQLTKKGLTVIPLKVYLKKGLIKVLIGVAKGKEAHDRRDDIKKKITTREIDRAIKARS